MTSSPHAVKLVQEHVFESLAPLPCRLRSASYFFSLQQTDIWDSTWDIGFDRAMFPVYLRALEGP